MVEENGSFIDEDWRNVMMWFSLVISLVSIGIGIVSIVRTEREIRRFKLRERTEAELAIIRQRESMLRNDMPLGKLWPSGNMKWTDTDGLRATKEINNLYKN